MLMYLHVRIVTVHDYRGTQDFISCNGSMQHLIYICCNLSTYVPLPFPMRMYVVYVTPEMRIPQFLLFRIPALSKPGQPLFPTSSTSAPSVRSSLIPPSVENVTKIRH